MKLTAKIYQADTPNANGIVYPRGKRINDRH